MAGMIGCMNGCEKVAQGRGLCISCYHRLVKRVNKGEITWEKAEKRGLCKPVQSRKCRLRRFERA